MSGSTVKLSATGAAGIQGSAATGESNPGESAPTDFASGGPKSGDSGFAGDKIGASQASQAGHGGRGGDGLNGQSGGTGQAGGTGGDGAGGAGGTVRLVGTVVNAASASVDVAGGIGGGSASAGGSGRLMVGSNVKDTSGNNVGVPGSHQVHDSDTKGDGLKKDNLYYAGSEQTPYIAGLQGLTDTYGLLPQAAADTVLNAIRLSYENSGDAIAAVYRIDLAASGNVLGVNYSGFDLLVFVNLTTVNLTNPRLMTSAASTPGPVQLRTASNGVLSTLPAHSAWATLVPANGTVHFAADVQRANAITGTIADGNVRLLSLTASGQATVRSLNGLTNLTVSDDGQTVYGVSSDDNALVVTTVSPTGELVPQQTLTDGTKSGTQTVTGLSDVADVLVLNSATPGVRHVYTVSPTDGSLNLFRSSQDVQFELSIQSSGTTGIDLTGARAITASADGQQIYVATDNGVVQFHRNTTNGTLSKISEVTSPASLRKLNDLVLSSDEQFLYGVRSDNNTLVLLDTASLTHQQTVSGISGASAVTAHGEFVFVTSAGDSSVHVFHQQNGLLSNVQSLKNGSDGVQGIAGASGITFLSTSSGDYVMVTGAATDAVAVFLWNQTEQQLVPVQTVRNHLNDVDGLVNPAAIVASQDGQSVFVATNNTPGSPGGLVRLTNTATGGPPETISLLTEFATIESLTVSTAGGNDQITLINAPAPEVITTAIETGNGDDTVVLLDASPDGRQTSVSLGGGDDTAWLRAADAAGAVVDVNG
ncbi:MAG: hypothetical protein KDA96_18505, partial [Planctomycetaceae bacterium]|nr:hypothetical protein [Planctomycetaceae bacterium]